MAKLFFLVMLSPLLLEGYPVQEPASAGIGRYWCLIAILSVHITGDLQCQLPMENTDKLPINDIFSDTMHLYVTMYFICILYWQFIYNSH